jgi:hypothetical protein
MMLAPLTLFQWRSNGASQFAPLTLAPIGKSNGAMAPPLVFRNGAPMAQWRTFKHPR